MDEQPEIIFREVQKFALWLRWLVYVSMILAVLISILALLKEFAQQRSPDTAEIIIAIVAGLGIPIVVAFLFLFLKLETEVRSDGLYVRFVPFHIRYKKFTPEDISEVFARTYHPLREYGGWGIRCSIRNGKAYNTSGNEGVQLVLSNDKKLLIGSQMAQELEDAIKSIMGY